MPKTITVKTVAESAYGKPVKDYGVNGPDGKLLETVPYGFSFEELQKGEEIPAKENPDAEDIRKFVNNKRKANARQKELGLALSAVGIEKPTLDDPEEQFKQMVAILKKSGKDEDTARQMANANLGTDY